MYKNDEKEAALTSLAGAIGKFSPTRLAKTLEKNQAKKADSHLAAVEMPKADKPTAAGEETSKLNEKPEEKVLSSEDKSQNSPVVATNPEMKKLSVVLSQAVRKAMSTQGQYTPYNVGVSTRPQPPAPVNPPPVGSPPQQGQQPQQGQNPAAYQGALGGPGAISPSSNPINNYGPLSASGDVNGNAAFGVKNSPDSNKSASVLDALDSVGIEPQHLVLPAAGAGVFAIHGGLTGPKNKKLLNALRGAGVGAMVGTGGTIGGMLAQNATGGHEPSIGAGTSLGGIAALIASRKLMPPVTADKKPKQAEQKEAGSSPAWQRSEGQNSEGGLNAKGRASYNKATGGNLKAPVTESNPTGERDKRQNSFCARMCGMKSKETGAKTKADPDSRINKSLSKWNCKCGSAYEFGKWAASVSHVLDTNKSVEEGKKVENVKPALKANENKADLDPTEAIAKEAARGDATMRAEKRYNRSGAGARAAARGDKPIDRFKGNDQSATEHTPDFFRGPDAVMGRISDKEPNVLTKEERGPIIQQAAKRTSELRTRLKSGSVALDIYKRATVDSYAGLSSGGQRWQLGESGINPRVGYKYLGGVVPMPDVSLRVGLPGVGGGIGLDPLPYVFGDSGQPSGRHANLPRSFWKKLQDGFRSPEDSFFLELSRIKDNAPVQEYENFLRSRGVGSSSEEIGTLAKILSESTDVKRNAMAKRLPMAVNSVLKNYKPDNPKSLFMGKQSSVALDIYAKYAARGDMTKRMLGNNVQAPKRGRQKAVELASRLRQANNDYKGHNNFSKKMEALQNEMRRYPPENLQHIANGLAMWSSHEPGTRSLEGYARHVQEGQQQKYQKFLDFTAGLRASNHDTPPKPVFTYWGDTPRLRAKTNTGLMKELL